VFTGIVEQTAVITDISGRGDTRRLALCPGKNSGAVKPGDSVSVSGVCLTVVDVKKGRLVFDVMGETLKNTTLGRLKKNDPVNMERALGQNSRIDGHFVLGHVDSVQKIKSIKKGPRARMDISVAPADKIYVVKKGSIAIDGVGLTVGDVYEGMIRVYIIPYTLRNTNLKYKKTGDAVNVEFDILGKYIQKRAPNKKNSARPVTAEFLKNEGFI